VVKLQTAPTIAVTLNGVVTVVACAGGAGTASMVTNSAVAMAMLFLMFIAMSPVGDF
jgi:hypothetical protein